MYLMKFAKYKKLLAVAFTLLLSITLAPDVSAQSLTFGLSYGSHTGLGQQDVRETISRIINVALSLLGIIALVIILVGGFEWMTAGGNEEKTTEARKRIFAGIIGLAIILSSYAIANFVLRQLYTATTGGTSAPATL